LLEWLSTVQEAEMDLTMMTLYQMWPARNDARESRKIEEPEMLAKHAVNLTKECATSRIRRFLKPQGGTLAPTARGVDKK
jgi:hypothetical protein